MTKLISQINQMHSTLSNLVAINAPRCEFAGSWDYKSETRVS